MSDHRAGRLDIGSRTPVNIPVLEYRQSGKTETEVPEFWKPTFRKIGNRHRGCILRSRTATNAGIAATNAELTATLY